MLAERSVRRLSIRAPDDALARRGGFLIEDALRTASLPGDGAGLLLVRRVRLPPFRASASPQQLALQLEAACREATALDGTAIDDAALSRAAAVRFADVLAAHLALTRLILAGGPRRAWCWPLLVKAYRPALGSGAALRAVALSLAALPEAPAALLHWAAQLVAHGEAACATLLLALEGDDAAVLERACRGARRPAVPGAPTHWQAALAWSAARLGAADERHRWLREMARTCGVAVHRWTASPAAAGAAGLQPLSGTEVLGPRPIPATREAAQEHVGRNALGPAGAPDDIAPAANAPVASSSPLGDTAELHVTSSIGAAAGQRETLPPAVALPAGQGGELPAGTQAVAQDAAIDAPTAAGGLLFMVPLLARLGLPEALAEGRAQPELPQRLFALLLQRLAIDAEDPAWLLCDLPQEPDGEADRQAAGWLGRCRRALRCEVRIGLHTLVCRPAAMRITPTHVDLRQPIDAVDLRIRRAGLDLDPGWVPWLGRVLRFHYGRAEQ